MAAATESAGITRGTRIRMILVVSVLAVAAVRVGVRAWELQVVKSERYSEMSRSQYQRSVLLPPGRAPIIDRNGADLAISVMVPSISANPGDVKDPAATAALLSPVIGVEPEVIVQKLSSGKKFVWLARRVGPAVAAAVGKMQLPGVDVMKESKRFYPNRRIASHILGFAGYDSVGLEGIELEFNEDLIGKAQVVSGLRDARGRLILSDGLQDSSPGYENSVVLSIDKAIQAIAEEEVRATAQLFEASSAMAVVVRPATGEILAIANYPDFDPNHYQLFSASDRRNRAVTDRFEPGSTMKVFTIAAALASGKLKPSDVVFCENGRYTVDDLTIHDAHKDAWLTPLQVLQRSSNVGAVKIANNLGKTQLYRYLSRFGFGSVTGIPFPGETAGFLRHYSEWYNVDLASIAFGHGISVSAVQVAMALSAVANGGRLLEPILVKRIVASNGTVIREYKPKLVRKVIDGKTARLLTSMMVSVTEEGGTGVEAALEGFPVAGKTGTAQKVDFVTGGYAEDKWTASFMGFVPADDPQLAIVVIVDDPVINYYGGVVAAPIFRRIADRSLRYLGVAPYGTGKPESPAPAVVDGAAVAGGAPDAAGAMQAGAPVAAPGSVQGPAVEQGGLLVPVEVPPPCTGDCVTVPDLLQKGLPWILEHASEAGISVVVKGNGRAVEQLPPAGTEVLRGETVFVRLEPAGW